MAMHLNPKDLQEFDTDNEQSRTPEGISPDVFRELYVALGLQAEEHIVIGITSAIQGEGSTTVAHGFARTLASDLDSMVSLIEVDFEHPTLSTEFGMIGAPGLADVLHGRAQLSDVRSVVAPNLCFVPCGSSPEDAGRLLYQLPEDDPFHRHPRLGGVVILDLPPLLSHAYSALAARVADATVLVVRAGVTPVDVVRQAVARFEDQPPRGVVLNGVRPARRSLLPRRSR